MPTTRSSRSPRRRNESGGPRAATGRQRRRRTLIMIVGRTGAAAAMALGVRVLAVACAGLPPAQTDQTMAPPAPAPAGSGYETPPVLKATDLAPAGLLSGPNFRVTSDLATTGLLGVFAMQSDFGPLDPHGVDLLRIRV